MKILDLHCDTLYQLNQMKKGRLKTNWKEQIEHLQVTVDKMQKGDYLFQCFAVYTDAEESGDSFMTAMEEIDIFYELLKKYHKQIGQVRSYEDIAKNQAQGKICGMLTIEDGGCCKGNLALLRDFYRLGVRMMTLTWNYENELAYPNRISHNSEEISLHIAEEKNGLKEKGIAFLEEMEALHMIIDVSHLSDKGFEDIAEHTKNPFIASHSNARGISPHVRNLTDRMIRVISERGGLIGVNYNAAFLDTKQYASDCQSSIALIADHISYIKKIGGVEIIGLGSDFDGITCDTELKDASYLPLLEKELKQRGFQNSEIGKIFHANALRVFRENL